VLDLGESLLNGVEVRRVRRQIFDLDTCKHIKDLEMGGELNTHQNSHKVLLSHLHGEFEHYP